MKKAVLVLVAYLLALLWLLAVFRFPAAWQDRDGMNELVAQIGISVLLLLHGLVLCGAAAYGVVRFPFALAVVLAPLAHLLGSSLEVPLCLVFLAGPSLAILLLGLLVLRPRRRTEPQRRPGAIVAAGSARTSP